MLAAIRVVPGSPWRLLVKVDEVELNEPLRRRTLSAGLALVSAGVLPSAEVPTWVIGSCALAMGLGTAVGGWRIVRTLGMRIVKLEPVETSADERSGRGVVIVLADGGTCQGSGNAAQSRPARAGFS